MQTAFKYLISILVFVLTLGISLDSVSADGSHSGPGQHRDMTVLFPKKIGNTELISRPERPELVAPSFLAQVPNDNFTLEWKAVEGADKYHVQIATDGAFKWLVVDATLLTTTNFKPTGLETGKKYFWRVFAYKTQNEDGYKKSLSNFSAFLVK